MLWQRAVRTRAHEPATLLARTGASRNSDAMEAIRCRRQVVSEAVVLNHSSNQSRTRPILMNQCQHLPTASCAEHALVPSVSCIAVTR